MADEPGRNIAEGMNNDNDMNKMDDNSTSAVKTTFSTLSPSVNINGILSLINGQFVVTPLVSNSNTKSNDEMKLNQSDQTDAVGIVQSKVKITKSKSEGKPNQFKYKCKHSNCHWSFRTLYKLQRHEKAHSGEKPYKCPIDGCGRAFSQLYNLKAHAINHKDKFICTEQTCHRTFETVEKLNAHCKRQHKATENKNPPNSNSEQAESNSANQKSPDNMLQVDTLDRKMPPMRKRKFVCDKEGCQWSFLSTSKLKRHLLTHTNQKAFICDIECCGKSFRRESHLKQHAITHTGEKPYECQVVGCKGRFSARTSLNVHMRKHETERPFKCSFPGCDKGYITPANLKSHMKKHEGCEAPTSSSSSSSSQTTVTPSFPDESCSIVTSSNPLADDCGIVDRLTLESLPRLAIGGLPHEFAAAAFGEAACAQYIAADAFDNVETSVVEGVTSSTWNDEQHRSVSMTPASFMELESSLTIENEDHFTLLQNGTAEIVSSLMQSDITVSISQSSPSPMSGSRQFLPINYLPEVTISDSVLVDHLYANQSYPMNFDMIDSHCEEIVSGDSFIETTINLQDIR